MSVAINHLMGVANKMDPRMATAENMLTDIASLDKQHSDGIQPIYELSSKYDVAVSTARLYLRVARFPDPIKDWISGQSDMPFLSFFTAANACTIFKEDAVRVLMHAYHSNKMMTDRRVIGCSRVTAKYLMDISDDIGAYCNPRYKAKDEIPKRISRLIDPDEYSREWCMTRINRLVCEELMDSLIAGVADDDSDSFYVKMPRRYGMELRRTLLMVKNMNEKVEE